MYGQGINGQSVARVNRESDIPSDAEVREGLES